jgi:heme exporter protein A
MRLSGGDLACVRGGRNIFSGLNFFLDSGTALLVAGNNGAGKSSLLRMIAGLVRVAHGRIELEGGDSELSVAEQSHLLGHQDPIKPALSVAENLQFWTAYLGKGALSPASAMVAVALDDIADLPAAYLSAGQRRRLSIARLLAVRRPIWLLDEPTSSLDAAGQGLLAEFMLAHLSGGGLIIAATHGPIGLEGAQQLRLGEPTAPERP